MNWRPRTSATIAADRQHLLDLAHRYFRDQDVLHVDTPLLGITTVTNPNVESFRTTDQLYLQTSPEYFMKRLLADGYPDIYSINRVFRRGESGRRHLPEFTMIEWYRKSHTLQMIIDDTTALISTLLDTPAPMHIRQVDYAELFCTALGIDIHAATIEELAAAAKADRQLRHSLGADRDAWLDLLLATNIVDRFKDDELTVIQHYPLSQAALARRCPATADCADRFEVFIGSVEIANGYVELTDPAEQQSRFTGDLQVRNQKGLEQPAIDTKLLAALQAGLPQCAGVALGFERLHMIAAGTDDIRDVVTFAED